MSAAVLWHDRLCASTGLAQQALAHEYGTARATSGGYFHTRSCDPGAHDANTPLARLFEHARLGQYTFDPFQLWSLLDQHAAGRFILTEMRASRLHIVAWGKGYTSFSPDWIADAKGKDAEDHPDVSYARRAADAYKRVGETGEPLIDSIEASHWWPGRGRIDLAYTRLVLPVHVEGRGRLVLSSVQAPSSR